MRFELNLDRFCGLCACGCVQAVNKLISKKSALGYGLKSDDVVTGKRGGRTIHGLPTQQAVRNPDPPHSQGTRRDASSEGVVSQIH